MDSENLLVDMISRPLFPWAAEPEATAAAGRGAAAEHHNDNAARAAADGRTYDLMERTSGRSDRIDVPSMSGFASFYQRL